MPEPDTLTPTPAAPRKRGRPPKAKGAADSADSGRRLALIAAAARHFRDKGFDATTTRDIASATGMQSGSPFYHFKSKHELLFAIMEAGMQNAHRSQNAVLAGLPAGTAPRDVLEALVLNHLYVLWLPGNDFVPVMIHEWRSLTAEHRQQIQNLKNSYEEPWRELLQQLADAGQLGTDASLARSMLFSVIQGSMRWFKPKGRLSLEALAQQCVNAMVWPVNADVAERATRGKAAKVTQGAKQTGSGTSQARAQGTTAFDPVPVVRQANGLRVGSGEDAGAVLAQSPLAQPAKPTVKPVKPPAGRLSQVAHSPVKPHAPNAPPAPNAPKPLVKRASASSTPKGTA